MMLQFFAFEISQAFVCLFKLGKIWKHREMAKKEVNAMWQETRAVIFLIIIIKQCIVILYHIFTDQHPSKFNFDQLYSP